MTTSDQHDATELQQHPIRRFGVHALMTTGSIMTLLAMLPSGFAGVPFMVMVSAVFVALLAIDIGGGGLDVRGEGQRRQGHC